MVSLADVEGSPPPMRGKESKTKANGTAGRITPAYAGKRCKHEKRRGCRQDHPRLCGEKHQQKPLPSSYVGSPPPMRGKASMNLLVSSMNRITPAYAGKRLAFTIFEFTERDHPRLCGEKRGKLEEKSTLQGSPPPMRGKAITVL